LGPFYQELEALVKQADVVGGDETKFRVGGGNGWLWVFEFLQGVLYVLAPTRGSSVPAKALDGFQGTLVTDAWDPYNVVRGAKRQFDLLHGNRWLERVEVMRGIEPRPLLKACEATFTRPGRPPREFLGFADGLRSRFREAVRFAESKPSQRQRRRAYQKYRRSMHRFLGRAWKDRHVVRIAKELRAREDQLFTFVLDPKVPWHNNGAERAIRQGVLHRKISGGRRTWTGAQRFQVLLSVYETCKRTGENFLAKVKALVASGVGRTGSFHRPIPQT
jgi:transposase